MSLSLVKLRQEIEVLFHRLLLGDPADFDGGPGAAEYEYAFARAEQLLHAAEDQAEGRRFELRLRLALHLAPAAAIAYDPTNPVPRHRLIHDHLTAEFGRDETHADRLSRDIAKVLRSWEEDRRSVAGHREDLLKHQNQRCAHCHVHFLVPSPVELSKDELKPYHLAPLELRVPEVDHIEAVSCLGTNQLSNLQVLCRLCNAGKGDGLGLDVRREMNYAGCRPVEADRHYRAQLVYSVILRDRRKCTSCNGRPTELTIRMVRPEGALVRSNLKTLCCGCAGIAEP